VKTIEHQRVFAAEPHVEDIANHNDPESCGVCREVRAEALTGGNAGQPLSFEIYHWGADRVVLTGRHYRQSLHRDGGDKLKAPEGKAVGRNPVGRCTEKSDEGVVPQNPLKAAAEAREGRPKTKGNSIQPTVSGALESQETSSGLSRIRAAARNGLEHR
jgi:hypothetical protein